MKIPTRAAFVWALLIATTGIGVAGRSTNPAAAGVRLGIEGRANATPWLAASQSFVAAAWGASVSGRTDVFVAISRDAGRTFGAPVRVNTVAGEARLGGELPPRVALARTSATRDPEVVVLWTARGATTAIRTARSRDGGRRFDAPMSLQQEGAPGDRGWPSLAIDDAGAVHALWLDHRGLAADRAGSGATHHHAPRQASGPQGSGQAPRDGASASHDGVAMAMKSGLYYARAGTPGERELAKGVCYCCKTALAAGPGGALYAAWRHVYAGNIRDIAFAASGDGGRTFTPPVRVSEDRWQIAGCPDDGPALAVDREGTVHIVWPTVVGGSEPEGALFYASSRDGRTFTPRLRVPSSPGASAGGKPGRPQIAVANDGRVIVAWDELRGGRRAVVVRDLRPGRDGAMTVGQAEVLQDGAAAYPVLATTSDGVLAAWTSGPPGASRIAVRRVSGVSGVRPGPERGLTP